MLHVAPTVAAQPPSITELIEAERQAFDRFSAATAATGTIALGRETTDEEEAEYEAAGAAQHDAFNRVMSETPRSNSDLVALFDHFDERHGCIIPEPIASDLSNLFVSARAYLDPDGCGGYPHPVDVLWAEWHDRIIRFDRGTAGRSKSEAERLFAPIFDMQKRIATAEPSVMQVAASVWIELYHGIGGPPASLVKMQAGPVNDPRWICLTTLRGLRPLLSGAIRRAVDHLFDNPNVSLNEAVCAGVPPMLLAAE